LYSKKICHVTSVHSRYDTRIFFKECKSLSKNGYDTTILVNDLNHDEVIEGIKIYSTQNQRKHSFISILKSLIIIKKKIEHIDAYVYHLHDPELLLLVRFLKKKKKIVIFDSHEDYFSTVGKTEWIPRIFRRLILLIYKYFERYCISTIDGAIVCYHWTYDRYVKINMNSELVFNFPQTEPLIPVSFKYNTRSIAFAGGVNSLWCHTEVLCALSIIDDVQYELAGPADSQYLLELHKMRGWSSVRYHGKVAFEEVFTKIYANCSIGIALLDYIPACKGTIGNLSNTKLFECMYAGLPVICTDFDLWKEIIEQENCGICVNPHNIEQIVSAITYLLDNPDIARQMGENGRNAVMKKYNWDTEEQKLLAFYDKVLNQNA
jgi:glycosyltransferase involved in cell wall biosynthesis